MQPKGSVFMDSYEAISGALAGKSEIDRGNKSKSISNLTSYPAQFSFTAADNYARNVPNVFPTNHSEEPPPHLLRSTRVCGR